MSISQVNTVKEIIRTSAKVKSIELAFKSDEITFNKIKSEHGEMMQEAILYNEIRKMLTHLKADLSDIDVPLLIEKFTKTFGYYHLSDITAFTDFMLSQKQYRLPSLNQFYVALDEYDVMRSKVAEYVNDKKRKEDDKQIEIDRQKTALILEAMKRKASIPEKTQKQKDAEAIEENNRKIERLKMMYNE